MEEALRRIRLRVPAVAAAAFEAALAQVAAVVLRFDDERDVTRLEGLALTAADAVDLDLALSLAAAAGGVAVPRADVDVLAERDWAAASRAAFPPVRIGRFQIHASDCLGAAAPGATGLAIDAGLAFGSGRHGSTAGCLLALDALRRRPVRKALDIGCGSGILALAMAKIWRASVVACDIDDQAVAITRANAALNQVAPLVRPLTAAGCRSPAIAAAAPFDLIIANILAKPLRCMAGEIASVLSCTGRLVLSGFSAAETASVQAAYRARGLCLKRRIVVDGWATLVLAHRSLPPSPPSLAGARGNLRNRTTRMGVLRPCSVSLGIRRDRTRLSAGVEEESGARG
jgi:ribosomal protein L11 methyltransferase